MVCQVNNIACEFHVFEFFECGSKARLDTSMLLFQIASEGVSGFPVFSTGRRHRRVGYASTLARETVTSQ